MARHDGKLQANGEAADAEVQLLMSTLDLRPAGSAAERQAAIVCLLSASEGWRDASGRTGGAFADDAAATRLRGVKEE